MHRDVSPQNVFVSNDGQIKVLDFGIAKANSQEGRTATGIVKGKVGYIAPEQARAESVDRRADHLERGVVLWEALTGARLFKAETDAATLGLTLQGQDPERRFAACGHPRRARGRADARATARPCAPLSNRGRDAQGSRRLARAGWLLA